MTRRTPVPAPASPVGEPSPPASATPWPQLTAVAALAVILYAPALRQGFVSDDFPLLWSLARDTRWGRVLAPLPGVYHYIPGALAYWKVGDLVLGFDPVRWHALAIALHGLAAILVGLTLLALGRPRREALWGAAFFACFFAGYETVAFAHTSYMTVGLLFYLGAVLLYRRHQAAARAWTYPVFLLAAGAAVLTYEAGLLILPVAALLEYLDGGWRGSLRHWRRYLPIGLLLAAYLASGAAHTPGNLGEIPSPAAMGKRTLVALFFLASANQVWLQRLYFTWVAARVAASALLVLGFAVGARRGSRGIQVLLAWVLLHQLLYVPFTAYHARYYLFTAPAAVGLWAAGVAALSRGTARVAGTRRAAVGAEVLVVLVLVGGALHVRERLGEWEAAGREVGSLVGILGREQVCTRSPAELVLLDLEATRGTRDDVLWPPPVFNSAFNAGALFRASGCARVPPLRLVATRERWHELLVANEWVPPDAVRQLAVAPGRLVIRQREDRVLEVVARPPPGSVVPGGPPLRQ